MLAVKNQVLALVVIDAQSAHACAHATFDAQQYTCSSAQANALYSASARFTALLAQANKLDAQRLHESARQVRACALSAYMHDCARALDLLEYTIDAS